MAAEWHYSKNGQQHGPVSAADLKAMAQAGELAPTDKVWKEGMAEWKAAGKIKGLFPSPPGPAPDRPAPPPLPGSRDGGTPSELSAVLTHPLARKVLSDKLLLLGCCLGVSVILTLVIPSLLAPKRLSTFPPDILAEPGFENVKDWSDPRLEAEIDKRQRENTRNAGRHATSGMTSAVFVLIDVALVVLIGFVGYRRYFATATDKLYEQGGPELPPNYPWAKEERTAPNPKHLWVRVGIGACTVIGVICLLSIVGAIFCLPFFSAATLPYVFGINRRLFHGRWIPASGKGWVEFLPGHVVKREDGSTGAFALLANQQFIDFLDGGKLVDSWKVLSFEHSTHLEVLDMAGKTHGFKRAKIGVYKGSSLFSTARTNHLDGSWQPVTDASEWMEFTSDGAVVFSNGSAGRYTVIGEEPNEVIELEMVGGASRQFKIVSLTPTQLVIAEGDEATTFRRPGKVAKNRVQSGGVGNTAESSGAANPKGVFGGLFSFFTKWKCPKCGKRSADKTNYELISDDGQRFESRPDRNSPTFQRRQVMVNVFTCRESYRCTSCGHEWNEVEQRTSQA